jgi:hypothetical protein
MFDRQAYTVFKFGKKIKSSAQNKREMLDSTLPVLRELFRLDRVYFFDWQQ